MFNEQHGSDLPWEPTMVPSMGPITVMGPMSRQRLPRTIRSGFGVRGRNSFSSNSPFIALNKHNFKKGKRPGSRR